MFGLQWWHMRGKPPLARAAMGRWNAVTLEACFLSLKIKVFWGGKKPFRPAKLKPSNESEQKNQTARTENQLKL